jgi:ribosomal protein S18 acetylase RimI-like enzyme
MYIRLAQLEDLIKWQAIAEDVAQIFGNPNMANDPEFIEYAQRKISQKEAYIAVDDFNKTFYGFIGFSKHFNRITWFGVLKEHRNKGIGSKLLEKAIEELDKTKEITVETYRKNYDPGKPARHTYEKHGFKETENNLYDHFGNERAKLVINPQNI